MGIPGTTAVLFSGIGTLLFLIIVRNRIPSYLGTSAVVHRRRPSRCTPAAATCTTCCSASCAPVSIFAVVGVFVNAVGERWITPLLPPVLTGTVVMLIGLNLAGPVARDAYWNNDQWLALHHADRHDPAARVPQGLPAPDRDPPRRGRRLGGGRADGRPEHRPAQLHDADGKPSSTGSPGRPPHLAAKTATTLGDADWIGLPDLHLADFSLTALLLFLPVVIVLIAENTGHVKAVAEMTGADLDKDLGRAFIGDGVATAVAGAFGGAGTTTYAENIGVMAATRVYSTAAYSVAAIVAILFGLCPKFGVLVGSIPAGVLGGMTIVLYGMIAVLGAKIWVEQPGRLRPDPATSSRRGGHHPRRRRRDLEDQRQGQPRRHHDGHHRRDRRLPPASRLVKPEDEVDEVVTPTVGVLRRRRAA